ncbi:hypothetical protein ES319_A02G110600v1 [Gossypium barbadense]|uniref:NAB domain-containing protein n=2 Tax=Gossypium TaxID=3633 RepID=A0A5J5WNI9_GOSBA|nr:hypothetical protein ES319_A02G110600v1 [Gossypium barbadense]TYH28138.1 hypothetical protein ES288_A02G121500v1 [Gossypium darwinii]KAB2093696.1 hypothetical protein ES319_A02G110600v1 [Gossypium barbadense]KAB2093697.1 hypothetical protein ES319_A02G110600v1 [Gossypium barbadense]KAB2093698.1 hypothetical protein ES319_A02G110600v1 [Gossypium barbadense]
MRKHRFRESMKSFFGHHVDPEKDEQLKGSKIEIDDKVTKILKLIKDGENDSKKEPLVQLIEDFHKHYQSLYEQYDHLTGELRKKVHGKQEKDALSLSSSDSDSDYSSKDRNSKNGQLESEFQKIADGIKQELEEANLEIADLKRKLTATSEEKDALSSDYLASLSKVQEAEETIENLKLESERSESEKSKLLVENEELRHKLDAAAKVEAEVNQRLESAEHQVMELGEGLNATVEENKSLNSKLSEVSNEFQQAQGRIQQLMAELSQSKEELVEKERELLTLKELHDMHGSQSSAQIKELEAHVTSLELELESLQATNRDMAEQLENKASEAEQLGEQNIGLQSRISELEMMLEKREEEVFILTKKLEDDNRESLSGMENLTAQVNNLLSEMESLQAEKALLEENLAFKGDEASNQVQSLMDEVNTLQQQLESLHSQKAELELQLEREKQESSERLNEMENQKSELKQMVEDLQRDLEAKGDEKNDHQRMLKEQEDAFNKLSEEYRQLETSFQDCKALIEVTERKMQEMAGEHDKSVHSKDQTVADLEQIIEDLKRDLEMKGDEISTFVENVRTIEVKLRLSNQKLRVTEQLLTKKEESFRKAEAKFMEEQRMLEERITTLSANNEAYRRMITDISGNVNNTLTGFEAINQKFEEGYSKYKHCVEETSKELRIAKHWVGETKSEKKRLMNEMTNLIEQLKDQKEKESTLREQVEKLQIKANKEENEKENLMKSVKQLENKVELLERAMKEKDEGILGLGEEKREAIRQLCMWIDYHRSRCDDLKEILSKSGRVQRAS